ncbi:MAG: GNAT family N-acetyltransferase [Legionellaceae bacterium]|nr:GNAT family N-acetyltransferase [Legionellaceae bacterium]
MKDEYIVTHMTKDEVELAIDWAANESWNPGLNDAKCFYATDPNGFFIGKLNDVPVTMGSAVIYDDEFAFCGLYMASEDYRHKGFGYTLTKKRLEYIGSRNAGLDGLILMVSKYENLGYQIAHYNTRYRGCGPYELRCQPKYTLTSLAEIEMSKIVAFDRLHFPAPRDTFLNCWLKQKDGAGFGVLIEDKLCGYGYIRPCRSGFKIGPLFADNQDIAEEIFLKLIDFAGDKEFYIDCPETNLNAKALAFEYDLETIFQSARMYLKYEPKIAIQNVYGITSLELG